MTQRQPKTGKKRTIIEETVPVSSPEDEGPTPFDASLEEVEDLETLQEVLGEHGVSSVHYRVYRQSPEGQLFVYEDDWVPGEKSISESFIQRTYGGGTYFARIFINNKFKRSLKFLIAPPLLSSAAPVQPNAGVYPSSDRHSEFLEKALLILLGSRADVAPNPGPSITELTTALSNLDNLRGKQETGIEMLMKGIELSRSLNGETDWKSDLIRTAKEVAPGIMAAFGKNPSPSQGVPINITPGNPNDAVRSAIQYLKQLAIANVSPETIIEMAIAHGNNPQYQPIIHAVITQEFSEFAKIDPEIGTEPFFSWFKPVFNGLRSAFSPAGTVDDDSAGDVGNTVDTGNHGEPSPNGKPKSKSK